MGYPPQNEAYVLRPDIYAIISGNVTLLSRTATLVSGNTALLSRTLTLVSGNTSLLARTATLDISTFTQETAAALDVDGTTWKDLKDKSTITKPVKISGFKVTKGGTWTGNAKIRITDGNGTKIFPFQSEYVEGTDFADGEQAVFNFPVVVLVANGYKFQFRSSSSADGTGETLQLNNLDVIECG